MITLQEARERIGAGVVYTPRGQESRPEDGIISSVGVDYVFVRYRSGVAATDPLDLEFLASGTATVYDGPTGPVAIIDEPW